MEGSFRFLMLPWKHCLQAVFVLLLDAVLDNNLQQPAVVPGHPGVVPGGVGDVEQPLADGRHPDLAAQGLDLPHGVFVGEGVGPAVDLADDADDGPAAVVAQGQVVEGAPGLLEQRYGDILPVPHGSKTFCR